MSVFFFSRLKKGQQASILKAQTEMDGDIHTKLKTQQRVKLEVCREKLLKTHQRMFRYKYRNKYITRTETTHVMLQED